MNYKEIDSHEAACKVLEKDSTQSPTTDQKITDICNAINKVNGNFKADFNNPNQKKYRPFFITDSSGFRFGYSGYDVGSSGSYVGSRLCHYVSSREEADYLGQHFFELHKAHYMGD